MQAFRTKTAAGIDLIPPERTPRRAAAAAAAARHGDYIDVEFETLAPGQRRSTYPVFNDNRRTAARPVSRAVKVPGESLLPRLVTMVETRLDAMPARGFAGLVTVLGLIVFLLMAGLGGQDEADAHPLMIEGVTASLEDSGGMRVLSVYGTIDNRSGGEQRLPSVIVEVMNSGRKVTATRLMHEGAAMAPGERRHFVARLPYSGGKRPDVTVSFAENSASLH